MPLVPYLFSLAKIWQRSEGRAPERRDDFWEKFCGITLCLSRHIYCTFYRSSPCRCCCSCSVSLLLASVKTVRTRERRERTGREERHCREGTGTIPEGSRCQRWLPVSVYVRVVAYTYKPVAFRICCRHAVALPSAIGHRHGGSWLATPLGSCRGSIECLPIHEPTKRLQKARA